MSARGVKLPKMNNGFRPQRYNSLRLAALLAVSVVVAACTVKPTYYPSDDIPQDLPLSSGESRLSNRLMASFKKKYLLSDDQERIAQLERVVDHLARSAGADDGNWRVVLLDAPEVIDVRAVAGNRIFVWSGIYDSIENEDELAGLLAYEIAHDLARHTDPVRFNLMSSLLFQLGSLAGSTALMIASQGAVNVAGVDWMKLAYIEARDLGPDERFYNHSEERRAATIALMLLRRSECRPEALVEFYWRTLEAHADAPLFDRLHRSLSPDQRIDLLENLINDQSTQTDAAASIMTPPGMTVHPALR
jgi:predicted Zn-dependent protease